MRMSSSRLCYKPPSLMSSTCFQLGSAAVNSGEPSGSCHLAYQFFALSYGQAYRSASKASSHSFPSGRSAGPQRPAAPSKTDPRTELSQTGERGWSTRTTLACLVAKMPREKDALLPNRRVAASQSVTSGKDRLRQGAYDEEIRGAFVGMHR